MPYPNREGGVKGRRNGWDCALVCLRARAQGGSWGGASVSGEPLGSMAVGCGGYPLRPGAEDQQRARVTKHLGRGIFQRLARHFRFKGGGAMIRSLNGPDVKKT